MMESSLALVELSPTPAPWPAAHIEIALDEDIPDERRVRVETRLGAMSLDRSRVMRLPGGLPGFPGAASFALVRMPGERFKPFLLMQLIEDPSTSFFVLPLDLNGGLHEREDLVVAGRSLGIAERDLGVLAIATLRRAEEGVVITLNLRAPILIDIAGLKAWQHIMENERYPIRFRI